MKAEIKKCWDISSGDPYFGFPYFPIIEKVLSILIFRAI
jgi:hypothetical protein